MLSAEVKNILELDDDKLDRYNLTSMCAYDFIIRKIFKVCRPKLICEIGADEGLTTSYLAKLAEESSAELHVVDPALPRVDVSSIVKKHEMISSVYLKKSPPADIYFVDGDHNYETVQAEINSIVSKSRDKDKVFVLCHDVSWPCAYRDMYYTASEVSNKRDNKLNAGVCLEHESLTSESPFGGGNTFSWAEEYGGERNGVLKAVEDFFKTEESVGWKYFSIPSLYGLGVIYKDKGLNSGEKKEIDNMVSSLETIKPFLSTLEANRLRLFQGLQEHQSVLSKLEKDRLDLLAIAEKRLHELNRAQLEREELFNTAEERLHEISRLGKDREELYETAEKRLEEIRRLGREREEIYQIAEQRLDELNKFRSYQFIKAGPKLIRKLRNIFK